jgi:5-methylcytosine-specific restriction enzyme A
MPEQRQPWHRWYSTAAWRKRRAQQLDTHPLCATWLSAGRIEAATVADHATPHRSDPDLFWHGPLQSLCALCHSLFKQSEEPVAASTYAAATRPASLCSSIGEPRIHFPLPFLRTGVPRKRGSVPLIQLTSLA